MTVETGEELTNQDCVQAGEPQNVMYGWCGKCRVKYEDKFQALRGNNCTYCGGDLEDNYPPSAICLAMALFPFGIIGCLLLKERQCVSCNRTSSA